MEREKFRQDVGKMPALFHHRQHTVHEPAHAVRRGDGDTRHRISRPALDIDELADDEGDEDNGERFHGEIRLGA